MPAVGAPEFLVLVLACRMSHIGPWPWRPSSYTCCITIQGKEDMRHMKSQNKRTYTYRRTDVKTD